LEKWIIKTVAKIQESEDLLAIKNIMIDIKNNLKFNHVHYAIKFPSGFTSISNFIISDYPEAWIKCYTDQAYARIDPILKHCSESQEPYCWDRLTKSTDQQIVKFRKEAASFGLIGGVSLGIHNHTGNTGIFSLAANHILKTGSVECCTATLSLTALQPYVHEAITKLSSFSQSQPDRPKLTKRELECLLWSAEGKTSDEIAKILSIKSPTVIFHLKNTIKKLGVTNRNQAIAKAVLLGIICPEYSSLSIPPTYHF